MRDTSAGVSFYDVRTLFRQVGGAHGGHVEALLYVPMRQDLRHAIDVRVRFTRRATSDDGGLYERGVSGVYPSGDARTLSALLFRLAYDLDRKLTEERNQAERLLQARLGI